MNSSKSFPVTIYRRFNATQKAKACARLPQQCAYCGSTESLTLDHILARALGGTNAPNNLQRLCTTCNATKAVGEYAQHQALQRAAFTHQAQLIHGPRYDYSQVLHPEGRGNIKVGCPTHGSFWCTPAAHLAGSGCARCRKEAAKAARQRYHLVRYGARL
jgi:hypothetical protein